MAMIPIRMVFLCISLLAYSCNSNEVDNSMDVSPESIWFDYKIWGQEDNEEVTVMLQYRYGGPNGPTLLLIEPSKVELDGEILEADSSKMTGAFYEILKPVTQFQGKHQIVYTDMDHKQYKEDFGFQPLGMMTQLPEVVQRNDLIIDLTGIETVDYVRILLTDTSFTGNGVNRVDTVRNGKITISKKDLQQLVTGPITLELVKENERRVKSATREGGRISITYGLRREFMLVD